MRSRLAENDTHDPVAEQQNNESPAERRGESRAKRIILVAGECDDAKGNLQQDGDGHQPADAMDREGRLPITVGKVDQAAREPTTRAVNIEHAARETALRHRETREPTQLDELIVSYLKNKRQENDRDGHRQHRPMPTPHEFVAARLVAYSPVDVWGMSMIVWHFLHRSRLPASSPLTRYRASQSGQEIDMVAASGVELF